MPKLLYSVAEQIDGRRSYDEIAEAASANAGRELHGEDAKLVIEEKLTPLGLIHVTDGSAPEVQKLDPLLALKFRVAVTSPEMTRRITSVFRPLFFSPVVATVLAAWIAVDVWLFGFHGVAQSVRQSLYEPALLLALLGIVILSAAFHEFGHAVACSYGGATPGVMGAGIYIAWPAFYTDVTDAYRLDKKGRLRTDLGGVYFNVVFILATTSVYFLTGWEFLLVVVAIQHLEIFHQLLPFIRLDGYYIITDLTGVPDLFTRVKPILKSLVPWKKSDKRVTELKPWARVVTTLWVVFIIPILLFNLGMIAYAFPRIAATAWDSADKQLSALDQAGFLEGLAAVVQVLILAIPLVGIALTFGMLARRLAIGLWQRTDGRPVARLAVIAVLGAAMFFVVQAILPDGNYKPIRRNETGTATQLARAVEHTAQGKPNPAPPPPAPNATTTDQPAPAPPGTPTTTPQADGTPTTTAPPTTAPPTTAAASTTTTTAPLPAP